MTGTDASTPGSPQTPPPPETLRSRLERVRQRLDQLEHLLPERRSRPLWHWYTQLDGSGAGAGAGAEAEAGAGSGPAIDDGDVGAAGGARVGSTGSDSSTGRAPGSTGRADGSTGRGPGSEDVHPGGATPTPTPTAPPWIRIPPILERAPLAFEDWTATFGHRLWLDRNQELPAAGPQAYRRVPAADDDVSVSRTALGLPGIWEDWRYFHLWAQALHDAGWDVHLLESLGDMTATVPELAERVAEHLHLHDLHDVVLFAHSKGGLVGKTVMLGPEGGRVRGLIACATPFQGAPITRLLPTPELSELSPTSPMIAELSAEDTVNSRIIQVEAEWDQSVPPSPLDGVRHITLPITGHSAMLFSPEVARTLVVLARQLLDEGGTGSSDDTAR